MPEALGMVSSKPAVLISGSVSEVTIKQVKRIEEAMNIQAMKVDVRGILKEGQVSSEEIRRISKNLRANMAEGRDSVITSAISRETVEEDMCLRKELGLTNVEISEKIASALGIIASVVAEEKNSGMILTGGTVAMAALRKMGALALKILNEITPGIPSGVIIGGKFDGLKLITKAGAFGSEDALLASLRYIKRDVRIE